MKKSFIFLGVIMMFGVSLYAQPDASLEEIVQEGNVFYEEEQFNAAIPLYHFVTDNDLTNAEINYKLAECYRKTFNYAEAETYYLKAYFLQNSDHPLSLYYYALMLKLNANYDESVLQFNAFIERYQNDPGLKEFIEQAIIDREGCTMAKTHLEEAKGLNRARLLPENVNTVFNDYAPALRDSLTMAITSGRILSNRKLIDERFGEAFSDNYYFQKSGTVWEDKTKQNFDVINSRYNDGSGCFNSQGDKYYFTVCGMDGSQCRVFRTVLKGNKWTEPIALNTNINFKNYESKQPAISHGGDTLLFVSNRPGGFGQYDIWMSIDAGDESWGPAMNLGSSVNTKLNELSPSLTPLPYVIFFASDGHEGYGGLDLYMSKKLTTGEVVVYNLHQPFNSNRDDCFISFTDRTIYFSSNRTEGVGGFDIYSTGIPSLLSFTSKVSLRNRDARRDIKLKSKTDSPQNLELLASRNEEKIDYTNLPYEKRKIVDKMVEGHIHNSTMGADEFGDLTIKEYTELNELAKQRYEDMMLHDKFNNSILRKISIASPAPDDFFVTGTLSDSVTQARLASVALVLTDELGVVLKTTRTNEQGEFRFTDVPSDKKLFIILEKPYSDITIKPLITGLKTEKSSDQNITYSENIYFDFDHYTLRPEASKVLDLLADYLKHNTGVQVEIFAFADDRGSQEYNLRLTQKRGQSVVNYLSKLGVDQTSLAIISKGKQMNLETTDEIHRQFSRRVEFYLNGVKADIQEFSKTYILKAESTWTTLSEATSIQKEELKRVNNSTSESVKAFQPVRIPVQAKSVSSELFFVVD